MGVIRLVRTDAAAVLLLMYLFFPRMIYYLDPSVLSGVSCFIMCLCLADYLVPTLAPRIFGSNTWLVTFYDKMASRMSPEDAGTLIDLNLK